MWHITTSQVDKPGNIISSFKSFRSSFSRTKGHRSKHIPELSEFNNCHSTESEADDQEVANHPH
jgi:hypothetical protein